MEDSTYFPIDFYVDCYLFDAVFLVLYVGEEVEQTLEVTVDNQEISVDNKRVGEIVEEEKEIDKLVDCGIFRFYYLI